MFSLTRILLPVDFSERCVGAARYVETLARRFASQVTLLHVLPPPHYEFSALELGGAILSEVFANRSAQVRGELDAFLVAELAGVDVQRVLLDGDPAGRIVAYAHEHADLVIMPTHGYGTFRRFILGSVTAKVLHDADCPVWTGVHLEQAPAVDSIRFRNVVAALDLGTQSAKTLGWAAEMAARNQASLRIVHAAACMEARAGEHPDPSWHARLVEEVSRRIGALQSAAGSRGEVTIETGDPPKIVCEFAQRMEADLLVIGRGSAAGVFGRLRTNAYAIIRQSPCPVVSV